MKRIISLILALTMALILGACGTSEPSGPVYETETMHIDGIFSEPSGPVYETETMHIDGIFVDDSYTADDGSPIKMVYLFYTLSAKAENLEIDSKYTKMNIGDTNTYESDNFASYAEACNYTPNYYYGSYIENVYVGTAKKVAATFKVPEGDLAAGKTITFKDTQIPDIEDISITTDDIQHFSSPVEIAQVIDPEGYAEILSKKEPADEETAKQVSAFLNEYYWTFSIGTLSHRLEFAKPNKFTLKSNFGTNEGTYSVSKGYVMCTYTNTGHTVEIPYELVNGEVDLDVFAAFDPG